MKIATKMLGVLLLGFFAIQNVAAQVNVEIEFRVNMGVQLLSGEFDPAAGDIVSVSGGFNGWSADQDTLLADFIDPNIYTKVIQLESVDPGTDYGFKFTKLKAGQAAGDAGWEGNAPTSDGNRHIVISGNETDGDTNGFLDAYAPAQGEDAPFFSSVTFDDVFTADTEVTITLDARTVYYHLADSSGLPLDVQTGDPVTEITGIWANGPLANSVNGWEGWGENLAARDDLQLVDDGTNGDAVAGDSVFTMKLMKTAGQAKRKADLKFGVNGLDNESAFAGNHQPSIDEANPVLNLVFGAMLQGDGTFKEGLYDQYILIDNSVTPPTATAVRSGGENDIIPTNIEIEFRVNMGVQLLSGEFDPAAGDIVSVSGGFNGWSADQDTLLADFIDPNIYSTIIQLDDVVEATDYGFKFTKLKAGQSAGDAGWEGNAPTADGNRHIVFVGNETDGDNNGYVDLFAPAQGEDAPFWSSVTFDDVFTADTEVTITLDARPVYYHLADSAGLPLDVQTGDPVTEITGIWANGPLANSVNGWEGWGENLAARDDLKLVDDGTGGDAVAGDSVFTIKIMKTAGQAKRKADLKFGVNGLDNESAFAGNHQPEIDEANPTLDLVFGAMKQADGSFKEGLYNQYILIDNTASPATAIAVRRGGENDLGLDTATDDDRQVPERVTLDQNYPNPFNPITTIGYELKQSSRVNLAVYDLLGRRVATLVNGFMPASAHTVQFDASNLASGMYIYRLETADQVVVKTMMLLK